MMRSFLIVSGLVFLSLPAAMQAGCGASEGRLVAKSDAATAGAGGEVNADDAASGCLANDSPCTKPGDCCSKVCDNYWGCVPTPSGPDGGSTADAGGADDASAPDYDGGPGCKPSNRQCQEDGECCSRSCNASVHACVGAACFNESSTIEQFSGGAMVGCKGSWGWGDGLCALGSHKCTAEEWMRLRSGAAPGHNYWVSTDLHYSTGTSGFCTADKESSPGATECGDSSGPMRVCINGNPGSCGDMPDESGNVCCLSDCGYESSAKNEYFGGCTGSTNTAGLLCCLD